MAPETRLHVGLTVTASMRHPVLGYRSWAEVPAGVAQRVALRTKPESIRKYGVFPSVIPIKDWAETGAEAGREAEGEQPPRPKTIEIGLAHCVVAVEVD
ncbi:MAG TPA: hypothetical protein VN203_23370, partial [Candidatus Acidoferrum sp.]|nr:hypothetical protein [Candidatus Acidoferrum sp.]